MVKIEIRYKKIGNFIDNNIGKYKGPFTIKFSKFLDLYLNSGGFFVFYDKDDNFIGYLDRFDIPMIKKVIGEIQGYDEKSLKELTEGGSMKLRTDLIDYKENVIDVLNKLDSTVQNFYPVVQDGALIGRVSKRILKEKIDEIY